MEENSGKAPVSVKSKMVSRLEMAFLNVTAMLLLIWGIVISKDTFIPVYVMIIASLPGGITGYFSYKRVRKKYLSNERSNMLVTYIIAGALTGGFALPAINYYCPRETAQTIQLPIISKSSSSYRSNCASPQATVKYDNVKREIRFPCYEMQLFHLASVVRLRVEKGILGYYIYTDKNLVHRVL